jgi:hypothetical protein
MIGVQPVAVPKTFDATARQPGLAWLKTHPDATRPRDYWSPHKPVLAEGFANLCGYAAMLDPTGGTVDHYLSFANHPELTYEWSNYRFASQALNASKRAADAAVLDPYVVKEGWFEILLPSLQLQATPRVPKKWRAVAEYTLKRLGLCDGEKILRWRRQWYAMYEKGDLTLEGLRTVAPLIAEAVTRTSPTRNRPNAPKRRAKVR